MRSPLYESRPPAFPRGPLILLIAPLLGCTLGMHKQAATPAPPKPAAVQPVAPDAPLSIPQTAVTLPSLQLLNPDAIPKVAAVTETPAPPKPEAPPAPRPPRRSAATPPKPEPDPEPETPATPPPAVQEQAPIHPILGSAEQKKIQTDIEQRKKEIDEKLAHAKGGLSSHDKSLVERIQSFLAQCAQAEQRGDYAQADSLSERAVILARELQGE
jgi:hypothetical protein